MNAVDFGLGVEMSRNGAIPSAIRPQNLVDPPLNVLHLSVRLDDEGVLRKQQHGVRLLVMFGERCVNQGPHPRWGVPRPDRTRQAQEKNGYGCHCRDGAEAGPFNYWKKSQSVAEQFAVHLNFSPSDRNYEESGSIFARE